MPPATDEELTTFDRTVADLQRIASALLCLVAIGMAGYTAVRGLWAFAALFVLGLALAVKSYVVAAENAVAIEDLEP